MYVYNTGTVLELLLYIARTHKDIHLNQEVKFQMPLGQSCTHTP